MLINHDLRLVVVTPPKTGSTSLRTALTGRGWEYSGFQHDACPIPYYSVAAVVRDPYTRALSLWQHRLREIIGQSAHASHWVDPLSRVFHFPLFVDWLSRPNDAAWSNFWFEGRSRDLRLSGPAAEFYTWTQQRWLQPVTPDYYLDASRIEQAFHRQFQTKIEVPRLNVTLGDDDRWPRFYDGEAFTEITRHYGEDWVPYGHALNALRTPDRCEQTDGT